MLKLAENKMAYLKMGLYGKAASGKSYTAALVAIGLHQYAKMEKPIAVFDTEPAFSFLLPLFKDANIPIMVYDESRAFADLMQYISEAEKECSIIIVDSITHVWKEIQSSFLTKTNQVRKSQNKKPIASLEFHHWGPIKSQWSNFTDAYLSSKIHFILCGRAGSEYSYQLNDHTNKMELISTGDRMATEKELAHEPSLLIEMVKTRIDGKIINRALIEKDRSDNLNGLEIDSPMFSHFLPHINALNIGGSHFDSLNKRDSTEMFSGDGEENWSGEKRQRDIAGEEIKALFVRVGLDGAGAAIKTQRAQLLLETFGTGSWTNILSMQSDKIRNGYLLLKDQLEPDQRNEGSTDDIPQ